VKAAVNGPEATALGASSAFKNEASAGLRRASVSGRRWRGAVANKRRQVQVQVQVREQSRSAGSSAGSSVAARRQLSGQLWAG
jgi:conjugal transfer/entry exclusion protein